MCDLARQGPFVSLSTIPMLCEHTSKSCKIIAASALHTIHTISEFMPKSVVYWFIRTLCSLSKSNVNCVVIVWHPRTMRRQLHATIPTRGRHDRASHRTAGSQSSQRYRRTSNTDISSIVWFFFSFLPLVVRAELDGVYVWYVNGRASVARVWSRLRSKVGEHTSDHRAMSTLRVSFRMGLDAWVSFERRSTSLQFWQTAPHSAHLHNAHTPFAFRHGNLIFRTANLTSTLQKLYSICRNGCIRWPVACRILQRNR